MLRSIAFILLSSTILGAQAPHRNWKNHPAIVQFDSKHHTYVIGDPHADPARLSALLVGARIMAAVPQQPSDVSWTAAESTVVFTGDLIDKGPDSLAVIALVRALQNAAAADGGRVIVTMGNHEAEFLADPTAEKTTLFSRELRVAGLNPSDVAACKGDLGAFLCQLPFAARVDDWFFSHGGNTGGRSLAKLSYELQDAVETDGFKTPELIGPDSLLEARLGDSPWFQPNGANPQTTLAAYSKALGVNHMVQGHQPGKVTFADGIKRKAGELFQRYGLIFFEDTGMSEGIDESNGAALLISPNKQTATAVCFDGTATVIWDTLTHRDLGSIPPCRNHTRN